MKIADRRLNRAVKHFVAAAVLRGLSFPLFERRASMLQVRREIAFRLPSRLSLYHRHHADVELNLLHGLELQIPARSLTVDFRRRWVKFNQGVPQNIIASAIVKTDGALRHHRLEVLTVLIAPQAAHLEHVNEISLVLDLDLELHRVQIEVFERD